MSRCPVFVLRGVTIPGISAFPSSDGLAAREVQDEERSCVPMTTVYARNNEAFDNLLKRFRRKVQGDRILSTARRKRFFISNSEKRRKAKLRAIRKARRRDRKRLEIERRYG